MKKIEILIIVLVVPVLLAAQNTPIDKLFEKYYGHEGFTTVLVNSEMFEVLSKLEKVEGEIEGEACDVFKNINRIRVLAQEDEGKEMEGINFMDELKGVDFGEYKELVVVKESDEEVLILAKEESDRIAEFLVIVSGDENVLVSIEGRFTMEDLSGLSELEGLDGLDGLEGMLE